MTDGKKASFTITIPKVGVGLQGGTLALVVWLGGQANSFVDQLTEGLDGLIARVTSLEQTVQGVGVDAKARQAAAEAETRNVEQDAIIDKLVNRVEKVEKCLKEGKRKCI